MAKVDLIEGASRRGHVLALEVREFPEYPGTHPKYYVTCSCGYRAVVRRTGVAAAEAGARHLRSALAATG